MKQNLKDKRQRKKKINKNEQINGEFHESVAFC